jgi:transposase-like protein
MNCPRCQSTQNIKYGHTHYGKPRFRCCDCARQFVENLTRQPIDAQTRALIDKLLLERLAHAAIARVTGVSERWLQMYVNPQDTVLKVKPPSNLFLYSHSHRYAQQSCPAGAGRALRVPFRH